MPKSLSRSVTQSVDEDNSESQDVAPRTRTRASKRSATGERGPLRSASQKRGKSQRAPSRTAGLAGQRLKRASERLAASQDAARSRRDVAKSTRGGGRSQRRGSTTRDAPRQRRRNASQLSLSKSVSGTSVDSSALSTTASLSSIDEKPRSRRSTNARSVSGRRLATARSTSKRNPPSAARKFDANMLKSERASKREVTATSHSRKSQRRSRRSSARLAPRSTAAKRKTLDKTQADSKSLEIGSARDAAHSSSRHLRLKFTVDGVKYTLEVPITVHAKSKNSTVSLDSLKLVSN